MIVPAGAAVLEEELAKRVLQNVDEGGVVGERRATCFKHNIEKRKAEYLLTASK